jgi:hypothetical protein
VEAHDTCFHKGIQNYTHEESGLQQFPKKNDLSTVEGKIRNICILSRQALYEIVQLFPVFLVDDHDDHSSQ